MDLNILIFVILLSSQQQIFALQFSFFFHLQKGSYFAAKHEALTQICEIGSV